MNFDIKKYLTENNLTSNSKLISELDVRKKSGIDLSKFKENTDDSYIEPERYIGSFTLGSKEFQVFVIDHKDSELLHVDLVYESEGKQYIRKNISFYLNEDDLLRHEGPFTVDFIRKRTPGWPTQFYQVIAEFLNSDAIDRDL